MNRICGGLSLRVLGRGAAAGLVAGIVLGLCLKWFQILTGERVYTLLLNIDFIPYMPMRLTEAGEFALHLSVSVPLGIVYLVAVKCRGRYMRFGVLTGVLASLTWVPLTLVSDRVPSIHDGQALCLWLIGHVIYGITLAQTARIMFPVNERSTSR
ncbi:hypothetical protein [Paenibacillus mendelii]|uniref:DUF1440 domain-containing protein n=1 Tax=Paenibacillus mendelii TaxID=206163 RepID=A0ABV6JB88_9BACL|nr:hypothetical protein [Paenibacillus mendelii]MCQ6562909.1 hypothetical protein [Paenibacillus mendelii]